MAKKARFEVEKLNGILKLEFFIPEKRSRTFGGLFKSYKKILASIELFRKVKSSAFKISEFKSGPGKGTWLATVKTKHGKMAIRSTLYQS